MNTLIRWTVILAVCFVLLGVSWFMMLPWASVRYRLTIEAEAGGQPITGSGVVEIRYQKQPAWLVGSHASVKVVGQSVWFDVPGEGPIFALLGAELPATGYWEFPEIVFRFGDLDRLSRFLALSRLKGRGELPLGKWPMFASFQNIRDPDSAEGIDPDELAVGTSRVTTARVKRIWIEVTRDPITTGLDEKLPALAVMRASSRTAGPPDQWPRPGHRRIRVSASHFSRGVAP